MKIVDYLLVVPICIYGCISVERHNRQYSESYRQFYDSVVENSSSVRVG